MRRNARDFVASKDYIFNFIWRTLMRVFVGLTLLLWALTLTPIAEAAVVATGDKGLFDTAQGIPGASTPDFDTGAGDTLPWDATTDIYVGATVAGSVSATSDLELNDIIMGIYPDVVGTLDVSSGANFTFNSIFTGIYGTGVVNFTGSTINADSFDIAHYDAAGNGTVTVDSSTVTLREIQVGQKGTGELIVQNSSTINTEGFRIADGEAGGTGTGTIDNSTVTANGLQIAVKGNGSLTIQNGSTVTSATDGYVHVARDAGTNGSLVVDNSTMNYTSKWLYIGSFGEGSLEVRNNSTLNSTIIQIGHKDDGTDRGHGTVLIDNSTWNASEIYTGTSGDGELTLQNGSSGSCASNFGIGTKAGGVGSMIVDNSTFTVAPAHNFTIGGEGDATLTIRNGGTFSTGRISWGCRLGQQAGSSATIIVDGGTWDMDPTDIPDITYDYTSVSLAEHAESTSRIEVLNGGTINGDEFNFYCGRNGVAEVVVDGAGSTWTSKEFWIGMDGTATGSITNGGVVTSDFKGIIRNTNGGTSGNESVMTVSGEGSAWHIVDYDSYFEVGATSDTGASKLFIKDSGIVSVEPETKVYAGQMVDSESGIYLSGGGGLACYAGWDYSSSLVDFLDWSVSSNGFSGGSGVYYWDTDTEDWADVLDGTLGTDYTLEYISNASDELYGYNILAGVAAMPEEDWPAGDANKDGKVDGSDVTILAGNWQRGVTGSADATWDMGDFNGDGKVDGSDVTILAGNWQYGVTAAAAAVPEPSMIIMLLAMAGSFLLWRRR